MPTLRALYICYLSLEDPLTHTQVVAYLEGLVRQGHTVHLLTYEPALDDARRRALEEDLHARGITWHVLRYHKRPSLPATIYDALAGAVVATRLVRRHRLDAVHARNHVPAATALIVRALTRCRLIFDVRGLMAEEYADAGRWRRGGVPFRITKVIERAAVRRAAGVVTLTHAIAPYLLRHARPEAATAVIPCCVDLRRLDTPPDERAATRAELGAEDGAPLMLYVGKFTGWYLEREMAAFLAIARERIPGLGFAVLTQADAGPMLDALREAGVDPARVVITRAAPEDLGRYLAAADLGISFVRPCFSKLSSSPTKIGEYLAAGLPVVSTAGIGDVDALLGGGDAGVLVHDLRPEGLAAAAERVRELLADPDCRERCRALAHRELSLEGVGIPRYDALYRAVAALG